MIKGNVAIGTNTANDWKLGFPNVYSGGRWNKLRPYIYTDGSWKPVGGAGTNMVFFLVSNGDFLVDNTGGFFLVREG